MNPNIASQAWARHVHNTHLAVLSGQGDTKTGLFELSRAELFGTAFPLAPPLFLTAWHVYDQAASSGKQVAVGRIMTNPEHIVPVKDYELFPEIDLAILLCPDLKVGKLDFHFDALSYLAEVAAFGFGFALTIGTSGPPLKILRAFRGQIVTRRGLTVDDGMPPSNNVPPGYEYSFVPPPGHSGAPLLSIWRDREPTISGVVLKHHTAEHDGRRMDVGVALDIEEILTIDSKLVGGYVAKKIFRRDPIPPRGPKR